MAGTITVTGLSASEPAGERVFGPITILGSQVVGESLYVSLASGDNSFTVPTGAVAAMILAPTNGAAQLTLRTNTNSADVGLAINGQGYPLVYPFPQTAPTTLLINASAAQTAPLSIVFI